MRNKAHPPRQPSPWKHQQSGQPAADGPPLPPCSAQASAQGPTRRTHPAGPCMWQTRVLVPVRESEIPMRRGPWPVLAPGGPSYFLQPRALEPPLFYAEGHSLENLPAVSDAELALENAFAPSKSGTANKAACPLNIHRASQAHGSASNPATPPDCHLPACR